MTCKPTSTPSRRPWRPSGSLFTPDARRTMLRMSDKAVAFGGKTADYAINNPAFVPAFGELAERKQDVAGVNALLPLRQQPGGSTGPLARQGAAWARTRARGVVRRAPQAST